VDAQALLDRQESLQREADAVVTELRLFDVLGAAGRVIQVGSSVTGLMVWRDLDFGVDAPGLTKAGAWELVGPLLGRCSSLHYDDDRDDARHYYVLHIEGWKIDISIWVAGVPAGVEAFQAALPGRLDDDLRMTILRLKDAWHTQPAYPHVVSAFEIYEAVLDHGVRTPDEPDRHLAARGLPTLAP
jgi:hypothetical protein